MKTLCCIYSSKFPIKIVGPRIIANFDVSLFRHNTKYNVETHPDHKFGALGIVDTSLYLEEELW